MTEYPIPPGMNNSDVLLSFGSYLRYPEVFYDNGLENGITRVRFIPDLTANEQAIAAKILGYLASEAALDALPDWGTWTAQEAEDNITGAIFNGATLAAVDAQIDALPATIAGMKAGLKNAAAQIIAIRGILANTGKAIVYLRNLVVRLR